MLFPLSLKHTDCFGNRGLNVPKVQVNSLPSSAAIKGVLVSVLGAEPRAVTIS